MIKTIKIFLASFVLLSGIFFINSFASAASVIYDFEVTNITVNPLEPVFNQESEITVTIKSINAEPLTDNSGVNYYNYNFVDFELSEITLPDISAENSIEQGETFKYIFKGVFDEKGEKSLDFFVNENQVWPETRLANNDKRVKVNVISGYDLEVSSIEILPSNPSPSQSVKVNMTIKNNGKIDLITSVGIRSFRVDFDDFDLRDSTIPEVSLSNSFNVGSSMVIVFDGIFTSSGEKNLNFFIDYDNSLSESDETNNEISQIIEVVPANELDISVDSIEIEDEGDGTIKGEDIKIIVTLKNSGNVSLTNSYGLNRQNFKYNFIGFSGNSIEYADYPTIDNPLEPGEIFTYTFKGKYNNSGEKAVNYTVDYYDKLNESNELNNYLGKTFYIYSSQSELDQFTLLNVDYNFISSTSVQIKWSTSKETMGEVIYRRDFYSTFDIYRILPRIEDWPVSGSLLKDHTVDINDLRPGEKYILKIRSYRNDIEEYSELVNFITPEDDTIQLEELISENINSNIGTAELAWNTNIMSSGYIYYRIIGEEDYKSSGSSDLLNAHNVLVENLDPGNYEYYLESKALESIYKSEVMYFTIAAESSEAALGSVSEDESRSEDESGQSIEDINIPISNKEMYHRLKGRIMLKVEDLGKAYYINPSSETMHYLGRPQDAFSVMREQGIGITSENLFKIPIGLGNLSGADSDNDGLSDIFEDAIGTDKNFSDTDSDGYSDKEEIERGYDAAGPGKLNLDISFSSDQAGKIFLQVENNGEAWYINPADNKRYFLGRPSDAFNVMRNLGLGISNNDFDSMR